MNPELTAFSTDGLQIKFKEKNIEIARVRIYFIHNGLHEKSYALIEDLFVQEAYRQKGYGSKILRAAIQEAKKRGCYKIIATSRNERKQVHKFYTKAGFKEWGKEFRMDLAPKKSEAIYRANAFFLLKWNWKEAW